MPNWCSNRMYFSGEPAQIAEIKRLASGAVTPFYRRATNEGIQLFLAGSAGLLQTTEDVQFEPCPGLTAAGRGVVSPENIAFTRWLTHLQNGVLLDEQNCLMLHELWLQSGTEQRRWEGLPDDVRDTITALFTAKRGDWCGFWSKGDENMYCTVKEIIREVLNTDVPDSECVFAVVLTRGDVRHIAQDWSLTDDELETVMQRLDDAFAHGADVSIVHDVVRELMEEKRASRQVTVPAVMLEKVMALAGSEMKRLYAVGSENGGDGDAFVREEREAMDVVLQALDGEHMS